LPLRARQPVAARHRRAFPGFPAGLALALLLCCGPAAFADFAYRAEITGTKGDLADLLGKVSNLKTLEKRPPASAEALRRRADNDLGRLADAAHSLGYWSAQFAYTIDASAKPAVVKVTVEPGPLYHVASVTVLGPSGQPLALPPGSPPLPLKPGDPALTAPVIAAEAALVAVFANNGHPFAKALDRHIVIDSGAHTMSITYRIDPGPVRRFGPVTVNGLERLDPQYVEGRLRWRRGAYYDARKVAETRQALLESGLFSTLDITPTPNPAAPDEVRMTIAATERLRRTLGVGIGYNTSQGVGANAFWENRNLFGHAEYLKLQVAVGQQTDDFVATFRRPDFLATDQNFLTTAQLTNNTPVAYDSRQALVSPGIERHFGRLLTLGIAFEGIRADAEELAFANILTAAQRRQNYTLLGLPAYLKLDATDNLLNPTQGWRALLSVTPAHTISSPNLTFVTNLVSASAYWPVVSGDRAVLAGQAALTSLDGAPLAELPADQKIYAGGGGSIRPYGYQMAGPLDSNNIPIGGKSSLVLNLEARIKVTSTIGVVPFFDAGSYYETSVPQIGRGLLYGVGLGLRYYTGFGPLRLDLATPLRRRSGDAPIQVYISLGQAF
jgi:translocation and assembly module TamA